MAEILVATPPDTTLRHLMMLRPQAKPLASIVCAISMARQYHARQHSQHTSLWAPSVAKSHRFSPIDTRSATPPRLHQAQFIPFNDLPPIERP